MKPVLYGLSAMFIISMVALFVTDNLSETAGENNVSSFGSVRLD